MYVKYYAFDKKATQKKVALLAIIFYFDLDLHELSESHLKRY
ncbi:MAG: hypothetical protein K0Q53_443 [Massilibacillus sp.]|jgi:hypothetical protein|nr:hypothetical protein [Massilibacillus sp.]